MVSFRLLGMLQRIFFKRILLQFQILGPVSPPDPPWPATTSHFRMATQSISAISASPLVVTSMRVSLSSLWNILRPHFDDSMVSSGPLFCSNDSARPTVTATGKMLVSGILESVLIDTTGRSCISPDTVGSLRAQLDIGGGAVVDDFQMTRVNLAVPSLSSVSVEEGFLVVPKLTARLIILGMTLLQSNCILYSPDFSITLAGPWERKHRIFLDGRVVRHLTQACKLALAASEHELLELTTKNQYVGRHRDVDMLVGAFAS
jgi:hypothetical protein